MAQKVVSILNFGYKFTAYLEETHEFLFIYHSAEARFIQLKNPSNEDRSENSPVFRAHQRNFSPSFWIEMRVNSLSPSSSFLGALKCNNKLESIAKHQVIPLSFLFRLLTTSIQWDFSCRELLLLKLPKASEPTKNSTYSTYNSQNNYGSIEYVRWASVSG